MLDLTQVSCCLITKEVRYPKEILLHTCQFSFGEIMILTGCDSPHRKQELFQKAKFDYIFYQDDDCISPVLELLSVTEPNVINCAMKSGHITQYRNSRIALLGWGSIFPKEAIHVLDLYRAEYGEDFLYQRETERIMTWFNYPQNRVNLPIVDLPWAMAPDRLSMQPDHYDYIPMVEERCVKIAEKNNLDI